MRRPDPYRRVVRRALRTVPHYRAQYAATGGLPPLTRDEAERHRHLLMPLGAAALPRRDPGPPPGAHVAELREALHLAGHRVRGRTVHEVGPALRDPVRAYGATWRVLLSDTADVDPYAPPPASPRPGPDALIVGDPAHLPPSTGTADGGPHAVARTTLAAAATAPPPPGSLLYEPWLGHLGAVRADCGALHLSPARVHARRLDGVTVLTLLLRRRPTLVHVRPEGAESFRPERCRLHGGTVLRRTS